MKRSAITYVFATAFSLLAVGIGACNSGGQGDSSAEVQDPAHTPVAANPPSGQTGTTEDAPKPVTGEAKGADAIGKVTTISGTRLPQGMSVDYSAGAHEAPAFSWKNGLGESASLADYRGKVVMLNFWGTWCPPCRRELPDIVRLRDNLAPKGFEVIGVSIGERIPAGTTVEQHLAQFAGTNDLRYPLLVGNEEMVGYYGGISAVPTTFIINKEGKIVNMLVGGMTEDKFRQAVEAVL